MKCDYCLNYQYDEDLDYHVCEVDLDEDEMARLVSDSVRECPYFQMNDEYRIVRKHM